MKKTTLFLSLVLFVLNAQGQSSALKKAGLYVKDGELVKAKEQIDLAAAHDKTKGKGKTWYTKGIVYSEIYYSEDEQFLDMKADALKQAVNAFNKVHELEKENTYYDILAGTELDKLYRHLLDKGSEQYSKKNYAESIEYFENIQILKPKDTIGYLYAGIAAIQTKNVDKVIDNYTKLIDIGIEDPTIYTSLVYYLSNDKEEYDKALKYVRMGKDKFPHNMDIPRQEVNILIKTDKFEEAITKLQKSLETDPNAQSYFSLGVLYDAVDETDKSIESYKNAIEVDPTYFNAYYNLSVKYVDSAGKLLNKANNMDIRTYQKEGKALEDKANEVYKQGLPYLEKVHELDPKDDQIITSLGVIYSRLGMRDKAAVMNAKLDSFEEGEK